MMVSANSAWTADSPTTVMHVAQPTSGGVAEIVFALARDQVMRGCRVHLVCPASGWLAERALAAGVVVHEWHASRASPSTFRRELRELSEVVRATSPDVVHLHSSRAGLAGRLVLRGRRPTIFQPHAWSFYAVRNRALRLAIKGWERLALRWTAVVVVVSADEFEPGLLDEASSKAVRIANGVDLTRFTPVGEAGAPSRRGPVIACVGRICRQKGQDLILDCWPLVTAAIPDARLMIVGDGEQASLVRERALSMPSVTVQSATGSPEEIYRAADAVVVPSRWEGMALVPLEAMACGKPVVGFDVGGMRESAGELATLVEPENTAALADAIKTLLTDTRGTKRLGTLARQQVVRHHDAVAMRLKYYELVNTLGRTATRRVPQYLESPHSESEEAEDA